MCGIAGVVGSAWTPDIAAQMSDVDVSNGLVHRGPDHSEALALRFGRLWHSRLRVICTGPEADQPLRSEDGRYALVFNGEIYNYQELAQKYDAPIALRSSDSRVLLHCLTVAPAEQVFRQSRGMFALALLDLVKDRVLLARDRFGEKPLYWFKAGSLLGFASELRPAVSIMRSAGVKPVLDLRAIDAYLDLGYVPAPHSLVAGISKLIPGTTLEYDLKTDNVQCRHWDDQYPQTQEPINISDILRLAVQEQLIADVPLGTFLSGGIDSTLVTMFAREAVQGELHSFSIGFEDPELDESRYSFEAAAHIGTIHHNWQMTGDDAVETVQQITNSFSEPLGDPSLIPTAFLSRLARQHVTVALSGDGADELFLGYARYRRFHEVQRLSRWLRRPARLGSRIIDSVSAFPMRGKRALASIGGESSLEQYLALVSYRPTMAGRRTSPSTWLNLLEPWNGSSPATYEDLRQIDLMTYLPDDILTKVDRAAMSVGLETRAPFLDPRVRAAALQLTSRELVAKGGGKELLKGLVRERFGTSFADRKKMGFGPPIGAWLKSDLSPWAASVTQSVDWTRLGLRPAALQEMLHSEPIMRGSGSYAAFSLLMLGNSLLTLGLHE